MALKQRTIRRKIDQLFQRASGDWIQKTTAELGNADGQVHTDIDGMIYARFRNGETREIYNDVAPEDFGVKVWIGRRRETPTLWQVIAQRDVYSVPQAPRMKYHAAQHRFRGPDELSVDRKQINQFNLIVLNGPAFIVQVYGGIIPTSLGDVLVESHQVDLSSYVPSSGAVFLNIEAETTTGALSVNVGKPFGSPLMASPSRVPIHAVGKYRIGYVLLWSDMEELTDDEIVVPFPIAMDLNAVEQNIETVTEEITHLQEKIYRSQPALAVYANQNFL